jgi:hypothetical protein
MGVAKRPPVRFRILPFALLCVFLLHGVDGRGQAPPVPERLPGLPPEVVPETTEVSGDLPADLAGRWFAVCQIKLPSGQIHPFARMWEIRPGPDHLEMVLHRSGLPSTINDEINKAGIAGQEWDPKPEELRALGAGWESMAPLSTAYAAIDNKIVGASAFTPEMKNDDATRGGLLALVTKESFAGERVNSSFTVLGVHERTPNELKGRFVTSSIAAGPMPIPITLTGEFTAYRVGSLAAGEASAPWWRRLLDVFSGCGCQRS